MQTNIWLRNSVLTLIFLVPFVPFLVYGSFFFPFITSKAFTFRIIVELAFLLWVILALYDPVYRPKFSWISKSILLFIVTIGLADLFGASPLRSFWSNFERMEGFIAMLHMGLYFLVVSSMLNTWRLWKAFWNTTLSASILMVLYSLFQLAGAIEINQGGVRVDGTLGNATYLAVYMLIHVFLAVFLYVREKKGSPWRVFYGTTIVLDLIILYFTATRGAILGLILGLVVTAGLLLVGARDNRAVRKGAIITLTTLVVLGGLFYALKDTKFINSSPVLGRFAALSLDDVRKQGRFYIWPMAVEGIKEKPLLGWGQENFTEIFNKGYNPAMYNQEQWFDRVHNIILDWGVAAGLLGILSYLLMLFTLLYSIWKKVPSFTFLEKSVLTGLVVAYLFQNFFVFDNLISYILIFSLLAFIHRETTPQSELTENRVSMPLRTLGSAVALIVVLLAVYYWNIRPIQANTTLIKALRASQSNNASEVKKAHGYFESAMNKSALGRGEVREQVLANSDTLLNSSNLTSEEKEAFFTFAKRAMEAQLKETPNDARYHLMTGAFLSRTGYVDEGLVYLERAHGLTPNKQSPIFEIGAAYIRKKDYARALSEFKKAYDLAPEYIEAKIIYLIGAIYARDEDLMRRLVGEIPSESMVNDNRVLSAFAETGRASELNTLLRVRIANNPQNPDNYIALASVYIQMGLRNDAILVLTELGKAIPESKAQADEYIEKIRSGEL